MEDEEILATIEKLVAKSAQSAADSVSYWAEEEAKWVRFTDGCQWTPEQLAQLNRAKSHPNKP